MKIRRRKITSETIYNNETKEKENRFPRYAVLKLRRHARKVTSASGKDRILPAKYIKLVNGKLTGRTKGAFGKCKFSLDKTIE